MYILSYRFLSILSTLFIIYEGGVTESELGINVAEVAKECGIQHIIYSTLPDYSTVSNGKYNVQHFSEKVFIQFLMCFISLRVTEF